LAAATEEDRDEVVTPQENEASPSDPEPGSNL
jgi:hypothetical protein